MPRIALDSGPLRLLVEPELGAGIAEFWLQGASGRTPLMRPAPLGATWFNDMACYVLAPWSNRIRDGFFEWLGRSYQLEPDWNDGTAIHGVVKDKQFRIVERSPVSATLLHEHVPASAGTWPWPFSCEVRYELAGRTLRTQLRITHAAASDLTPMPTGLGFHPFFPRSLEPRDQVSIRYASNGRYPAEAMLPVAAACDDQASRNLASGAPLGVSALDDVFLGSTSGAELVWPASGVRLRYTCSAALGHAVVYTGQPDGAGDMPPSFCFEPVSMVNDGFNLHSRGWEDTGVQSLAPGATLEGRWDLEVLA